MFGDTARTEALFDRIATRWQRFGPVTMIAAPDVGARTVDPGDVLRFATGNIGAGFIKSREDLARQLAAMDGCPTATAAIASTSSTAATTPGRRRSSS